MSRFALLSLDDPGNFNNDFDNGDDHSDDGNGGSDDGSDDSSDMDIDDDHQAPKYLRGLTGADLDLLMMRRRIESKGTWFMSNLSSASRFYSRRPMNLHPISNGDDTEPVDMLLYVKDIGGASQEQLVERFTNELKNANEYSRDPVYQEDDDDQISYRRIHANPAGFDVLRDFDTMILEVQRMDEALRKADYVNAATELFNRLCDLNGVEAPAKDSAGDTGIQVEIIRYASLYFAGRVRFLRHYIDSQLRVEELNREHFDKTDHPIQPHPFDDQPDWDKESVQLLIADFNSTVHGTNFLQDMRLVEFYANWSEPFMAREQNGHEKFPRITPQLCTYMFERTYCIPVERANLLATSSFYAADIEFIESWIGYKLVSNHIRRSQSEDVESVHREYYLPYVTRLCEMVVPGDNIDAAFRRRWRGNVGYERRKLERIMDSGRFPRLWGGSGRWLAGERKTKGGGIAYEGLRKYRHRNTWGLGWYCRTHRAYPRCPSCGTEYACAVCANPHTCRNCKSPFKCEMCNKPSWDPETDMAKYRYKIETAEMDPALVNDGQRITPRRVYVRAVGQPDRRVPPGPTGPPPPGGFGLDLHEQTEFIDQTQWGQLVADYNTMSARYPVDPNFGDAIRGRRNREDRGGRRGGGDRGGGGRWGGGRDRGGGGGDGNNSGVPWRDAESWRNPRPGGGGNARAAFETRISDWSTGSEGEGPISSGQATRSRVLQGRVSKAPQRSFEAAPPSLFRQPASAGNSSWSDSVDALQSDIARQATSASKATGPKTEDGLLAEVLSALESARRR